MPLKGIVDYDKLPEHIRSDIKSWYVENRHRKDVPEQLSVEEALTAYLNWNGIIGYDSAICAIFEAGQNG